MSSPAAPPRHTNRLAHESSPYLLQHAHNPVDWYPWGDEAFARAKAEDKPVFVSIGYATCHWCHVMERESFESDEIAALLNRDFVAVKVDREERPDIDNVYMTACQLMTQSGGWPLTILATPDGKPFFAGTYFPPDDRYGRSGMRTLLPRLAKIWRERRSDVEEQAEELSKAVTEALTSAPERGGRDRLDAAFAERLVADLSHRFDDRHGGFSGSPKFPPHAALEFLLARAAGAKNPAEEKLVRATLDAMAAGGIFDQVGGGFHRYSTDEEWFIPHFEKMLYDNAQLTAIYAAAAARYGEPAYARVALATADWLERDMKTAEGAYASAMDADSEGIEGKFYLWSASEIDAALGKEKAALYRSAFDIRDGGNTPAGFEEGHGRNLPRRLRSSSDLAKAFSRSAEEIEAELAEDNGVLERARSRRVPPMRDDKVVTSWNALAASALARAAADLHRPELATRAERIVDFLLTRHVDGARVLHVSRAGAAKIPGYLEDYASLVRALLDLSDRRPEYRDRARQIAREMVEQFEDAEGGGFFQTRRPAGPRGLLDLSREFLDQVTPSPNAEAAGVLLALDAAAADPRLRKAADRALEAAAPYARAFPSASYSLASLAASTRTASAAPPAPSSRTVGPVDSAISVERESSPDGALRVRMTLSIEKGWHVQSHRPSRPDLTATSVDLEVPDGWTAAPITFPEGQTVRVAGEELSVYSGKISIVAPMTRKPGAAPGGRRINATVRFQACDDSRCLAPATVEISVPLEERP